MQISPIPTPSFPTKSYLFFCPPTPTKKVYQSLPQRLSLLELVLDEESVSMVLRRMSLPTGSSGDLGDSATALIQGWSQICSRVGRSEGRRARHHLISCWHSGGENKKKKLVRKKKRKKGQQTERENLIFWIHLYSLCIQSQHQNTHPLLLRLAL